MTASSQPDGLRVLPDQSDEVLGPLGVDVVRLDALVEVLVEHPVTDADATEKRVGTKGELLLVNCGEDAFVESLVEHWGGSGRRGAVVVGSDEIRCSVDD